MATIQEVYIALFGRPADPVGYQYYVEATDNGANLDAVGDLSASEEYTSRFTGMSDIDRVNQIYQDLFGRPADAAGLLFYVDLLQNGGASPQDIAIRILDGASGTDQDVIDNKVEAAQLFTDSLDTAEEIVAYQGDAAAEFGRNFLNAVTDDPATIPTQDQVDAALETLVENAGEGVPGEVFTLTPGIDAFTGTDDNDIFQANVSPAPDGTLTTLDDIQGGAGTDTMNIVGAGGIDIDPNATINGVEVINIATTAAVTNLSSESFEGAQQVWQIGVAGDIEVGEGVAAGFRNLVAAQTVTAADGVSAVTVALDGVDTGSAITLAEATPADLTSVTVAGNTDDAATLTLTGLATVTDLTLSLTSNTDVTLTTFDGLTDLDASGSTGDLILDLTLLAALETFQGGSGNDDVALSTGALTADEVSFEANDGNDTFTITAAAAVDAVVTLEGGAGNDTFAFDSLVTVFNQANFEDSLIIISDFDEDEDVIDLAATGLTRDILNNTELADIADDATLEDAIDTAGSYTNAGEISIFDYDGDAYILTVAATGDLADNDGLVQLVGFSVEDIDSSNFVFA